MNSTNNESAFYLGLTMAGAVSAGCYTAGVIDYLFEILDLWERAKKGEVEGIAKELIPQHNVVIDAMGGTSAGGMATMMTALYALDGEINPVKEEPKDYYKNYNILYNSWVHLDDEKKNGLTFEKVWNKTDLLDSEKRIKSLFNSNVIDKIANGAFPTHNDPDLLQKKVANLPAFISKNLELLLSHTLLRGIPLEVNFTSKRDPKHESSPKHATFEHYLISHYKLNTKGNDDKYLDLNPYEKEPRNTMKNFTIATGAFPIGLKYRKFDKSDINETYLKSIIKRTIFGNFGEGDPDPKVSLEFPKKQFDDFTSLSIDGGAINNEPFREVESILKARHKITKDGYQRYGMIMIDPFPDTAAGKGKYEEPKDLVDVVPKIIGTLWDQSKVKRKEMVEQYTSDYFRGEIFPTKYHQINNEWEKMDHPLASASFMAFGGFLDVKFRIHDFFLGRDNARNFVRYFFSIPCKHDSDYKLIESHPIHKNWSKESVKKYVIYKNGTSYLPIIPDLNIVLKKLEENGAERYKYTISELPKYDPAQLFKLDQNIKERFKLIITLLKNRPSKENTNEDTSHHALADKWMVSKYRKNFVKKGFAWIGKHFVNLIYIIAKRKVASILAQSIIKVILYDLSKMNLLKKE